MKFRHRGVPGSAYLLILGALAAALAPRGEAAARAVSQPATVRPNIVLILMDDMDLRLASRKFMPRLDRLVTDRGATFINAYVPLSLCCPSRATILTGRYAHNLQVYNNNPPGGGFPVFRNLGHEEETIGVALQNAGYRTALMGKYLNEYPESDDLTHVPPGWDEWAVPAAGEAYSQFNYTLNVNGTLVPHGQAPADYLADVMALRARQFVTQASDDDVPFFLFFSAYAPHKPSTPAPRHRQMFKGVKAPRTPSFNEADVSDKPQRIRDLPPLTQVEIARLDQLYRLRLQSLQAVDEAIAALVQTLEKTGELDNTFIVFTSDNGFHMGQHRLLASKYTPYDEDLHIPLIVRGPGVKAGVEIDAFVENLDLAPTLAQLAGATLPVPPDGRSFVPLLKKPRKPPATWRRLVFLEQFTFIEPTEDARSVREPADGPGGIEHASHFGLRTPTYKFVEYATGELEYYDLVHDPAELNNLAGTLSTARVQQLSARVHALSTCSGRGCRELDGGLP
jgi:N-acetylglucosamine-6-sulfatase